MASLTELKAAIETALTGQMVSCELANQEITVVVERDNLLSDSQILKDDAVLKFDQLIDVCGVDYQNYGKAEWETEHATSTGFERGVDREEGVQVVANNHPQRFASVYHLLSVAFNHRVRIKVYLPEDDCRVPSVCEIWNAANWFEREAFDLMGILYDGHPDLRRILTDYGFIGHPFRKDFPLIGNLEMRYDATEKRVVYEPVSIKPRILVPKVIREDSRYSTEDEPKTEQQQG